jgi:hypothetical protein
MVEILKTLIKKYLLSKKYTLDTWSSKLTPGAWLDVKNICIQINLGNGISQLRTPVDNLHAIGNRNTISQAS